MARTLLFCIGLCFVTLQTQAGEFYVDPVNGNSGGDGLRGLGDYCIFEYNTVKNCYKVIITDHWHGITLGGARNCLVINNTVLDQNNTRSGPPWICIDKHKNGTASVNCVVRNNLATDFKNAPGVLEENNLTIQDPASFFVDAARFDLHLRPGAAAIDAGSSLNAPKLDRDRIARSQGNGIDIGAYEWHAEGVLPTEESSGGE